MTDQPIVESWDEPDSLRTTTAYLKRLLVERHLIRAKLENPGGSVIVSAAKRVETDALVDYSSVIGNTFHLDLVDAEEILSHLPADERQRLLAWCDGLTAREAAQFASVKPGALHKRNQRSLVKITEQLNDGEDAGRTG